MQSLTSFLTAVLALEGSWRDVLFARAGQVVAVGEPWGTSEVWDVTRGRKLFTIPARLAFMTCPLMAGSQR